VNKEGVVHAHDVAQRLTADELSTLTLNLFSQTVSGMLSDVAMVSLKLHNFFSSIAYGAPAQRMGQKCQMDSPDYLAVDLKGNVLTCQTVGADSWHRIGHLSNLDAVRLNTAWHWSLRDNCQNCPVLHLCYGGCMFMDGAEFDATCRNEYAYNKGIFMAALYFLTGKVLQGIYPTQPSQGRVAGKRTIPIKLVEARQ
jgi:uncharacterized protein